MSDNLKRFRAVRKALNKLYPNNPQGNLARHLNTLAAMISGIVGGKNTQLPKIAEKAPDGNQVESRVKRFSRFINNEKTKSELYFLPFAESLLYNLSLETLVLIIDGSVVGRGCICLMVSVVYKGRALPIAWTVVKGNKGHLPEEAHIELVEQVKRLVPEKAEVVFLGDGEFDGINLQKIVTDYGWKYVFRTALSINIYWDAYEFKCDYLSSIIDTGEFIGVPDVLFTNDKYGPVMIICWWNKGYKDPIYLVTNMDSAEESCKYYSKRFKIETLFSDQKSRGFKIDKSHYSEPERLSNLLIASCLAYIWIVYLGALCMVNGWIKTIHRSDRCDLSLFQIGLRFLEHCLNEGLPIPVSFRMIN